MIQFSGLSSHQVSEIQYLPWKQRKQNIYRRKRRRITRKEMEKTYLWVIRINSTWIIVIAVVRSFAVCYHWIRRVTTRRRGERVTGKPICIEGRSPTGRVVTVRRFGCDRWRSSRDCRTTPSPGRWWRLELEVL